MRPQRVVTLRLVTDMTATSTRHANIRFRADASVPRLQILAAMLAAAALQIQAGDWSQFLGPNRNGTTTETNLASLWPKDGPTVLWQRKVGQGFSGPVILRLSAWGARKLHSLSYAFPLIINWLPLLEEAQLSADSDRRRKRNPSRLVVNSAPESLPSRIWEQLVLAAGIPADRRWSTLSRQEQHRLTQQLIRSEFPVTGKTLNKDEFVTCGGVDLAEVNFKTMESRLCPGLFFAGELLDIDGVTGGFNFQAAWTTGWLAGRAMAEAS